MRKFWPILLLAALLGAQEQGPAPSRLDDANKRAAERVLKTVAREGDAITNRLRGLRKEDVIVVGGLFDFFQEVLVAFRCPHTVIAPHELEHHPLGPSERKIVFLNCHLMDRKLPGSQPHVERPGDKEATARLQRVLKEAGLDGPSAPGEEIRKRFTEVKFFAGSRYSEAGLKRLGQAVREGAWLMSTDWALLAVERALPGSVRWTGHTTFEERIEIRPSLVGKRHPLLTGAFPKSGKARWWIETESYLFSIKAKKHKLLIESRALASRYGGNRNVVVLVEPGRGRLLHALGHGYLQQGGLDDLSTMQRLLLNYLTEKSVQNWRRDHPKKTK
ncbi:MAG: hypothetical protein ACYTGV_03295 [Planctomycetota bacterium]|jgi:hypothetical protein